MELRALLDASAQFDAHGLLEDGAKEFVASLVIIQQSHIDKEDRQFDLAVILVSDLFYLHCHVAASFVVTKG